VEKELTVSEQSPKLRANLLGVGVSAITMAEAISETDELLKRGGKGYICVTSVHGVMEAQRDPVLKSVLNASFLTTPDGMPTVWVGKHQGFAMERVYGPEFMLNFFRQAGSLGYRHFLYGGNEGVAEALKASLESMVPGLQVVGTYTPPFRPLLTEEFQELKELVDQTRPDVMWIGLSTPKQERFMAEYLSRLDVQLMVGVGAAFDIHTGRIDDAPAWIKKIGMQWLHRLVQDPGRLWKRYLVNNPIFLWKIFLQLSGLQTFRVPLTGTSAERTPSSQVGH
jgi:N-acetylglucosaminyldiphosphoundecaprenol N-acetyl-beta-D-mannosaminyltransferase